MRLAWQQHIGNDARPTCEPFMTASIPPIGARRRTMRALSTACAAAVLGALALAAAPDVRAQAPSPVASSASTPAGSAPASDWRALNRQAAVQAKANDYAGLHDTLAQLAPLMPGSPTIAYDLAATAARLGHVDEALAQLKRLADAGLTYDLAKDDDFASLADRGAFRALRDALASNGSQAVGSSTRVLALSMADALPESLAWDAPSKRLFVSSVRHCEIRVIDDPLGSHDGASAGRRFALLPASVFALGIDAPRHRLWATIASVAQADRCGEAPPATERTALLALDLTTGHVVQRIDARVPGVLGDMLVADDGTVIVTESTHGAVLRLRPGATAFERIDAPGDFVSPQTPVLAPDGRVLLVPDFARGIAAIELGQCPCAPHWLSSAPGVFTAGIDGLVRDGATFVAVQNGSRPARVIRLSADLERQQVLESGTPGFGEPTHGIVVGRSLWFISDVGWDRFDDNGKRKVGAPPSHPELRALDLGAGMP